MVAMGYLLSLIILAIITGSPHLVPLVIVVTGMVVVNTVGYIMFFLEWKESGEVDFWQFQRETMAGLSRTLQEYKIDKLAAILFVIFFIFYPIYVLVIILGTMFNITTIFLIVMFTATFVLSFVIVFHYKSLANKPFFTYINEKIYDQ